MTRTSSQARQAFAALIVVVIALVVVLLARAPNRPRLRTSLVESIFQDDDHLVYASSATVTTTLHTLKALGVDRLRVTILWRAIAPSPTALSPPAGFDASNPASYPAAAWGPYDRLVLLARQIGLGVDFDLTAPGPLWAMARHAPAARYADHWAPSPEAFGQFVQAVGERYSGAYAPPHSSATLPRVSFWSVWNEPNQPGWLAPQWKAAGGGAVMEAPALYRAYVDAAWAALGRTGHGPGRDTILVGELAPEGNEGPALDYRSPIPPIPFIRALYCVDTSYRPLRGAAAAALACPQSGSPEQFVSVHPALFDVSGFAHHPYSFFLSPSTPMADPNFAPLSELGRLENGLDSIFTAYGVPRKLPLWLTEYGYETDPPNPFRGVSLSMQSLYIDEAQYMALRDPRVRGFAQFLFYDARPDPSYPPGTPGYWSTFQTGLVYADGAAKPSLSSYRLPVFLPDPTLGGRGRVLVWGMLRPAPRHSEQVASIQWRSPSAAFRTIARVRAQGPDEMLLDDVALPGPGVVRIEWRSPAGVTLYSRETGVTG